MNYEVMISETEGKNCRYVASFLNVKMAIFAQLFYTTAWTQGLKYEDACHFAKLKITKHTVYIPKFIKLLYYIVYRLHYII